MASSRKQDQGSNGLTVIDFLGAECRPAAPVYLDIDIAAFIQRVFPFAHNNTMLVVSAVTRKQLVYFYFAFCYLTCICKNLENFINELMY